MADEKELEELKNKIAAERGAIISDLEAELTFEEAEREEYKLLVRLVLSIAAGDLGPKSRRQVVTGEDPEAPEVSAGRPEDPEAEKKALENAVDFAFSVLSRFCTAPDFRGRLSGYILQYAATLKYGADIQEAKTLTELREILEPGAKEPENVFIMPDGPLSDLIFELLSAGGNLENLLEMKNNVGSNKYELLAAATNKRQLQKTSASGVFAVEVPDIEKLSGSNKAAKKILMTALIEANRQAVYNGKLVSTRIKFPLQNLVDNGSYKTLESARAGFLTGGEIITSLKTYCDLKEKSGKEITHRRTGFSVLFTSAYIDDNWCILCLNSDLDWSNIIMFYSMLPNYYFKISNRAQDLLYYIFYLARQNVQKIEKNGFFTISFRAIQTRLNLPQEKGCKNAQRDIRGAIDSAIEEIENQNITYFPNRQFNLLPVYDDHGKGRISITDYLNNGYLKVSFDGDLAKGFSELSKQTKKKIAAAEKKNRRIEEKAAAIKKAQATKDE